MTMLNGLNYFVAQQGSGAPVWLLLHGFMGSHTDFAKIAPKLAGTVLMPDLLGHGATTSHAAAERYQIERQVADLASLLAKRQVKQVNLLGYSMGGRLALAFALSHPELVHCLILESSSPGLATETERQKRRQHDQILVERLQKNGLAQFVTEWTALPLFASQRKLPAATQQFIRQQRLQQNPAGLALSLQQMGTGSQPNYWPALANFELPVHLIVGAADAKFQATTEKMLARLPNASRTVISNAGHNVHLEQSAAYLATVNQFVQREGS
ncbi:2-succinyl-6-hydroxy-2,4-cyclohexadiene-1-carboxylate synthase [Loigolactobacillus backii]|uniref:Putative 2-succinyl-6-hydroxy-2,4-cyclohexadiene-1-carboxylate synthase n=1 Tax=Loigolactobacillus backii TaxID=375175 RepID=A0A192H1I9_9LACO|nr:2-succinyl-6-hydroxy-2,4-cyclohexadiene-1-carboxylate synthase [Loigolactobacillus backii]ANK62102.1 hypothetical protein AYR53_04555 [Loigolactobacillus backii]ANK68703.1 hypothetical protein AYR56_00165 [Loigolactobacillus backii]MDA5386707.1 2-succinyl-6-hydroxy-2,4-cyclohexadiene-1-carboxylate synthase [Loigolactobacillus backii]MDA5389232.1 2-succinyl-6-hydroxy-2,4-cyclohexadiene-1-carboxylate synthase [Loigolactobacillus backii]